MIVADNVSKQFGNYMAVKNISFHLEKGHILGLIGANGSGKTTLIRMISTILSPTSGEIRVNGMSTIKNPEEIREQMGVLLGGDVILYSHLTAEENIEYFGLLQGMEKKLIHKRINELVELLNMQDFIKRRTVGFSRGMKQKVAFARTMIHNPKIILLDEPSTGLDVCMIEDVQNYINVCRKNGCTIVLSSHNMDELNRLCDDMLILKTGSQIEYSSKEDLFHKYPNKSLDKIITGLMRGEIKYESISCSAGNRMP